MVRTVSGKKLLMGKRLFADGVEFVKTDVVGKLSNEPMSTEKKASILTGMITEKEGILSAEKEMAKEFRKFKGKYADTAAIFETTYGVNNTNYNSL
ncbi:MAG: hypothetical protein E7351_03035 [Clostridiales bacterium]|nr:hypothetical protein [Clostridiales bacterium]